MPMSKEQKIKIANTLFRNTTMTKEQYETFIALAADLQLTIDDVQKWEEEEERLHKSHNHVNNCENE